MISYGTGDWHYLAKTMCVKSLVVNHCPPSYVANGYSKIKLFRKHWLMLTLADISITFCVSDLLLCNCIAAYFHLFITKHAIKHYFAKKQNACYDITCT